MGYGYAYHKYKRYYLDNQENIWHTLGDKKKPLSKGGSMAKGRKTTAKFDHRINIRVNAEDWHNIMLLAQKDRQTPSAWLREKIGRLLNGKGQF